MKASLRIGPTTRLQIEGQRAQVRGGHSFAECSEVERKQREYKQEQAGPQGRLNGWVRPRSAGRELALTWVLARRGCATFYDALLLRTIDSAVRQALPFTTRGMGDTLAFVAYKLHTLSDRQPATWKHANEAFNIISIFQGDLRFATGARKSLIVTSKGRLTRGLLGFAPEISGIPSLSAMAFLNRG